MVNSDTNVELKPNDDTISLCGNKPIAGKKEKPLTFRQERFCIEYTGRCNGNGTQAAINSGYKPEHAKERAYQLLKDDRIATLINTQRAQIKREISKTKDVFLIEVNELKALCREKNRLNELIKLMQMECDILGLSANDDASKTTVNVFGGLDRLEALIRAKDNAIDVSGTPQ